MDGTRAILETSDQFKVAKEYSEVSDALDGIMYDSFELFIIELPQEESGLADFFKFFRLSGMASKFIVITYSLDPKIIQKCIQYGASGLLYADKMALLIYRCVEKVYNGDVFICSRCLEVLVADLRLNSDTELISHRERQVLELLSSGFSYNEISESLHISFGTTKSHVYNIYKKLNAKNTSEAVLKARQHKLIE